ncbi:MAG: 2-hydroxyacid dehydrogenase [bacterium]
MSKPRITITRKLPGTIEMRLSELFDVDINEQDQKLTSKALIQAAQNSDILACTLGDRLDQRFFAECGSRLKMIANFGSGIDHIDVQEATKRGIVVTNTPSVQAEDAADMALALILAVPRRLVEGVMAIQADDFSGWSPSWMLGRSIREKKLGIIGLGRVGQEIAKRAKAFGLDIHYHNRHRINPHIEEEIGAHYWQSLDQMLARVDIVSVNCPHTPATYHLLSRRRLNLMKPDAYLVNVSRSEIIDELALADMIEEKKLAGAGLDVFSSDEELVARYKRFPNVVRLPHMASATQEARNDMGERMLINIKMFLDGHKPPDRIIPEFF